MSEITSEVLSDVILSSKINLELPVESFFCISVTGAISIGTNLSVFVGNISR